MREGLRRGLAGEAQERKEAAREVYPDMALAAVVERVSRRIGAPPNETSQDIDHFIMDGVVNRPLHTWGRREIGKPVTPIWKEAWERGDFSHERGTLRYRHPDNPRAAHEWRDIQFSNAEVKRWVRPDLGPHGWMAGDV